MATPDKDNEEKAVDIYRDTPVRFMGYANEVGEDFRALVNVRWVKLSYVLASGYVLADTQDKAGKSYKSGAELSKVGVAAVDTLVWQAFASVIVPGFFINRLCAASLFGLARAMPTVAESTRKWAVTGLGLGSIPLIIHPIDNLVHTVMDNTTRKWIGDGQ